MRFLPTHLETTFERIKKTSKINPIVENHDHVGITENLCALAYRGDDKSLIQFTEQTFAGIQLNTDRTFQFQINSHILSVSPQAYAILGDSKKCFEILTEGLKDINGVSKILVNNKLISVTNLDLAKYLGRDDISQYIEERLNKAQPKI